MLGWLLIPCSALLSTSPALFAVVSASLLARAPAGKLQPPTLPRVHLGRKGGWAVQETVRCGNEGVSCSLTPSSCGPPGETSSCCTGCTSPPPIASATVPQPARQWNSSRIHQATNTHLSFPTCPTLPVLSLLPLLLNPCFSVLLGSPCLAHWVLTAVSG